MMEVRQLALNFSIEVKHITDEDSFQTLINKYKAVNIINLERKHKFELSKILLPDVIDDGDNSNGVVLRWLYEPNATQFGDILNNYIKPLEIREYKSDIQKLIRTYTKYEMTDLEEEYNKMKEIDHEDEQSKIKWDGRSDVADLLQKITVSFSNYKDHLRLAIRLIAKQHSSDAYKHIEKYRKLFLSNINEGIQIEDEFKEIYMETQALRRVQMNDLESLKTVFELNILVNKTKIDMIISRVSELNILINETQVAQTLDYLDEAIELLGKEKGYEYFFREGVSSQTEERTLRNANKRRRLSRD